jgi:hypothetical protein
MNRSTAIAAVALFAYVAALTWVFTGGPLQTRDADHVVTIRNERSQAATVRLDGVTGSVSFEIGAQSEVPLAVPARIGGLRAVHSCATQEELLFGGHAKTDWSTMSVVVIGADGSLGLLLPEDLGTYYASRPSFPTASATPVEGCIGG